jgi:hypothetical protein
MMIKVLRSHAHQNKQTSFFRAMTIILICQCVCLYTNIHTHTHRETDTHTDTTPSQITETCVHAVTPSVRRRLYL